MPEDPSHEIPPSSDIDRGFALQDCIRSVSGKLLKTQLWLPASVSEQEMKARNQHALDECMAWTESKRLEQQAQASQSSKEQEVKKTSTGLLSTSAATERDQLALAARDAHTLLVRSFDEVLATTADAMGRLHVPVYAWDEPLKLIDRSDRTPDREVHRRGKDLYHRIRANHPSQARSVGYPLASHEKVLQDLEDIGRQMPHFADVLGFVRDSLVLSYCRKQPMRLSPILLLGDPGIGKTHFSMELARALQVPIHRHSLDGSVTDCALIGSDSHWSNTSVGLMFEALVLGPSASPVVLLDEIDKSRKSERMDPIAPLHTLLEPVSARAVTDISVKFTFDASHVIWIATGNDAAKVPAAIRSRFQEFMVQAPQAEVAIHAAQVLAKTVHARMGQDLFEPLSKRVVVALAHLPARQQIRALEMAFARALANGSRTIEMHHLPPGMLDDHHDSVAPQTQDDTDTPTKGYLH